MRRFTAEEKGKGLTTRDPSKPRIRIRAPDFDPSKLIKDNLLTLVGRLTNPKEQRMSAVLTALPKVWNLVGKTVGADLGNDVFHFRFQEEGDLQTVLHNRPYNYGRWMVLIQRWEPIISASFPSQIPFWISLSGIPLHYWHEKVVSNIGLEFGELETYEVTKSSARIRCVVDGLKPLIMESILEFDSGEESLITLEYEKLGNHCSYYYRLTHLQSQCPEKPKEENARSITRAGTPPTRHDDMRTTRDREDIAGKQTNFNDRRDRYGNPFGNRVSHANRAQGPKNKIAAHSNPQYVKYGNMEYRPKMTLPQNTNSPHSGRRGSRISYHPYANDEATSKLQEQNMVNQVEDQVIGPSSQITPTQRPLERNLDDVDFPVRQVPTAAEVLDDINEATLRYLNVDDPIERAARQHRVLQSEINGSVEATVAGIIQHSVDTVNLMPSLSVPSVLAPSEDQDKGPTTQSTNVPKKRGRPPKPRSTRAIQNSPRVFTSLSSRRRTLNVVRSSPSTHTRNTPRTTGQAS